MITRECPICRGDGIDRCDNPDHGFIEAMPGETGRLGCPVCGHHADHRIVGQVCEHCNGAGKVKISFLKVLLCYFFGHKSKCINPIGREYCERCAVNLL